ncbi:MAG: Stp1/IreP family PP2C-type Ser/Thr phosphatase [Clostridiales Family XIII bacterium]|jgi:protein phosphatase|nr:Stp1/IreP family PP2C-type Ser/Thr phosphatase [Clostridiales Family XIII bacterium]
MIKYGFKTDVGKRRDGNEDAMLVLPKAGIFAVADGVGGQNSGEIASRKAMSGVEAFLSDNPLSEAAALEGKYWDGWMRDYFTRCLREVNRQIVDFAVSDADLKSMATTAVLACFDVGRLCIVNVGDSRAYVLRAGALTQLTEDHTYVNNLIRAGQITKADARTHPQKNIITRALGAALELEPDFYRFDLEDGDRVLLCTDGLHGELTDGEITEILAGGETPAGICRALVKAANASGGNDNITVICIDYKA